MYISFVYEEANHLRKCVIILVKFIWVYSVYQVYITYVEIFCHMWKKGKSLVKMSTSHVRFYFHVKM